MTEAPSDPASATSPSITSVVVAVVGSLLVGGLLSLQAHVTGALAAASGDIAGSALITVGLGEVILTLMVGVSRRGRESLLGIRHSIRCQELPVWALLGGVGGAFFVVVQGTAAGPLGLAIFVMAVVAGQVTGGLLVDRWGVTDGKPVPVTATRIAGALGACAAVGWGALGESPGAVNPVLAALAFVGGLSIAWSSGANGRVQQAASNAPAAALVNHIVAFASMIVVCAAQGILRPRPFVMPGEPWLFSGGLLGVLITLLVVKLVRPLGVLRLMLGIVGGQLGGGLLEGALVADVGLSPVTVGAACLTFAAVVVASLRWPRRPSPKQYSDQD